MGTEETVTQHIGTVDDIEKLLGWIGDHTQNPNLRFYRHVFLRLYAGGEFDAVHVDALVRMISQNKLWSDQLNDETDTAPEILRDRLARRIRWLNNIVLARDDSPYRDTLALVYNRSSSLYQMVTDPESVRAFRSRSPERRSPGIAIEIQEDNLHQGLPVLSAENELEFSIRSSIDGYIHIFHQDGEGHVDKLFPEPESEFCLKVSRGKEVFLPDAISDLCQLKCWRIGALDVATPFRQKVFVIVTARNVDVSAEDALEELAGVQGRPIIIEHAHLGDLRNREKLSAIADYWLDT